MSISAFSRPSCASIVTLTLLSLALLAQQSHGVTRDVPASPGELVKEALHREIYGASSERQLLLSDARRKDLNYGPAQWHQGFIRLNGEWFDIDELLREGEPELMKEYAANRARCADTVEGQMLLANWCRDKQLLPQERAHLSRVVDLNGEHQTARERLGYRRVGGRWLTESEIASTIGRQKLVEDAAKRWRTELQEIGRDLQHSNLARQQAARARLAAIDDVHAIPIMESALSVLSQEGALAVVDVIGKWKGTEAVESLVRHAVFSQSPLVRQAAAERLKERKLATFVPLMLREMYTPLETRFGISELPDGRIVYTHAFSREGQQEQQVLRLDTEFNRIKVPDGDGEDSLMRAFEASFTGLAVREREAALQNAVQLAFNQRLVDALKIATYQDLPVDPKLWWQWWDKQNDVVRLAGKQTRSQYQLQQVAIVDRVYDEPTPARDPTPDRSNVRSPVPGRANGSRTLSGRGSIGRNLSTFSRGHECFAAGTKVWTRFGERPIESIRIGDQVLAQDVESGEIAFKPVLATTVRPPEDLVKVCIGKDVFECSHGHLFWVAGYGWAKADRLESGLPLHCLRGSSPISCVETGLKIATYNLVVADYNTFFVGSEQVLSHDVTEMTATEAVVPGLRDD